MTAPSAATSDLIGLRLAAAYAVFVGELHAALQADGFSAPPRWLGYVARALCEGPLTLKEIAAGLGMTSQGALKIIDDLEARGFVERRVDIADRRAKRLFLTERGEALLARADAFHQAYARRLKEQLGEETVEAFDRVLTEMARTPAPGLLPVRPV